MRIINDYIIALLIWWFHAFAKILWFISEIDPQIALIFKYGLWKTYNLLRNTVKKIELIFI